MISFRSLIASTVCLAFLSPLSPSFAQAPIGSIDGMVISVSDGSRMTVVNNGNEISVILYGVDAPVITKIQRGEPWLSKPGQPFAGRAFMALSNKVLHKQVRIEIMKIDHHGRMVAVVYAGSKNINLEMITEGWAWTAHKLKNHPEAQEYFHAEELAKAKRAGLWSQDNPQPPWEFRKSRKINQDSW